MINVDPIELQKFSELAHRWWDPQSEFKPLHKINPLRLGYVDGIATLQGKRVLDVGCGGGILSEAMAAAGARVTGIDLGDRALKVAQMHLLESGLQVEYRNIAVEELAGEQPNTYDIVTCMELLEHVPDPASVVKACARLSAVSIPSAIPRPAVTQSLGHRRTTPPAFLCPPRYIRGWATFALLPSAEIQVR